MPLLLVPAIGPGLALITAVVAAASSSRLSPAGVLIACAVGFCPTLIAAFRLARSAARLRTAALTA